MIDTLEKPTRWATGVRSVATSNMARDLKSLGDNYVKCRACRERAFALRCAVDALRSFLAPRFFTTVVAVLAVCVALATLT